MNLSLIVIIILALVAAATAMISAVIGMAGGIVLLSIMTFFLDLSVIVPVHGVVQLVSNSTRTLALKDNIEWRIFFPSLVGMPLGIFVATQLIQSVSNKEIFYFLIAGLILYVLFKPKKLPALKIPFWSLAVVKQGIEALLLALENGGPSIG